MPQFLLNYIGGDQPATPEEGRSHFAKYQAWLNSLGDSVLSPMNPLKNINTVSSTGGIEAKSTTGISGYTLLQADSIDEAIKMAQSCPFLDINGTLEISEIIQMPQ